MKRNARRKWVYKNYFEQIYSKHWKHACKEYGSEDGVDSIIEIMKGLQINNAYEIGIGTGYPIAEALERKGIQISGCDISERMVMQAKQAHSKMELQVYDIQTAKMDLEKKYDLVYCIRSSWYMKEFCHVIEKMISMAHDNGYVIFNIINKDIKENMKAIWCDKYGRIKTRLEGVLKVLFLNKDYIAPCPNFFYTKAEIEKVLKAQKVKWNVLCTEQLLNDKAEFDPKGQKLLFIVQKQSERSCKLSF